MKIKINILILAIAVSCFSCSKSFLEIDPSGKLTIDKLFSDMEGLRAAMNGTYTTMVRHYREYFTEYGDIAGDHVIASLTSSSAFVRQYNYDPVQTTDATPILYIWENAFIALDNSNRIINSIPKLRSSFPGSKDEIDSIEGQALLFRALCTFDLSRVYSQTYTYTENASHLGVPLLTETSKPGQAVTRATMKETYDFIIKDLKQAETLLRRFSKPDNYTVSCAAVWGLLSRIYLYKHDWDQAIAYSDSVILKSGITLTPAAGYRQMFTDFQGAGNEVIWQLYSLSKSSVILSEYETKVYVSKKLTSLFTADDIRNQLILYRSTAKDSALKYRNINLSRDQWSSNIKVLRLSEIYLNRAEAYWNKSNYTQAIQDVKVVSDRSHPVTPVAVPADPAQLYQFICDERSRELCFEGHRIYDITRRHQNLQRGSDCIADKCSLNYPNNLFVLPIPNAELDANRAMQPNPGVN